MFFVCLCECEAHGFCWGREWWTIYKLCVYSGACHSLTIPILNTVCSISIVQTIQFIDTEKNLWYYFFLPTFKGYYPGAGEVIDRVRMWTEKVWGKEYVLSKLKDRTRLSSEKG